MSKKLLVSVGNLHKRPNLTERPEIARPRHEENSRAVREHVTNLQEITGALIAAGYTTLDAQAKALGIHRATAWTIIRTKHKLGRLNAKTTERMLANPDLPPSVRCAVQRYLTERPALTGRQIMAEHDKAKVRTEVLVSGEQDGWSHATEEKESESETGFQACRNTQSVDGCRL